MRHVLSEKHHHNLLNLSRRPHSKFTLTLFQLILTENWTENGTENGTKRRTLLSHRDLKALLKIQDQ